jgi:hypothetical protein
MSKAPRTILTPGEPAASAGDEPAAEAVAGGNLAVRLAALEAENAALKAAAKPAVPSVVYTPQTPHGRARLAASQYAGMTVAELTHAIDTGAADELAPSANALCSDGYYCSRARIQG